MADLQQARAMSRNFKREYMASRRTVSKEKKKKMMDRIPKVFKQIDIFSFLLKDLRMN